MKTWHRRLVVDIAKALVLFKSPIRRAIRRFRPYRTDPGIDARLMADALQLARQMADAGVPGPDDSVLEFRSGWNPLLPLALRLAGRARVILTDQEPLLQPELLRKAARAMGIPMDEKQRSAALVERLRFDYLAPFLLGELPAGSVSAIVSCAVLEHVSERDLPSIVAEFRRLLRPGGRMFHMVDMSDHWEHGEKSLSRIDFLRCGDAVSRWTCVNAQNVQNRLRASDFSALFRNVRFRAAEVDGHPDPRSLHDLRHIRLAPRIASKHLEQPATLAARFVCTRPERPIHPGWSASRRYPCGIRTQSIPANGATKAT